jgi:hypothetical protein
MPVYPLDAYTAIADDSYARERLTHSGGIVRQTVTPWPYRLPISLQCV